MFHFKALLPLVVINMYVTGKYEVRIYFSLIFLFLNKTIKFQHKLKTNKKLLIYYIP